MGLNDPSKCCVVKSFIRHCKCCVICLQETKLFATSLDKFRSFCGFHIRDFRTLDAEATRGGLLTAWNPSLFECVDEWAGSFSLTVMLRKKVDGKILMISNVYGPIAANLRAAFFQELQFINTFSTGVWTVLEDFNVLLSVHDKNGSSTNVSDILRFREVVSEIGLLDLPILNKAFTWTNGRGNPTLERLDRAFISNEWLLAFPRSILRALPRPRSDHSPLVLSAFSFLPSAYLFRFESFWLRYPAVNEVVTNAWNSISPGTDSIIQFSLKITAVQVALKSWSQGLSSGMNQQATKCLQWIEWLHKAEEGRLLSNLEYILRPKLKIKYEELCLQMEIRWKQRSRVQWLKAGDANTKFFHIKAKNRRTNNFITRLSDGSSTLSAAEHIAQHLFTFFFNQLGVEHEPNNSINTINLQAIYGDDSFNLSCLQDPFTVQEVKNAIFSSASEKATGPDGLPIIFYQRFWNIIKDDILAVFNSFHNGATNLNLINDCWICLIPKKKDATLASDFRPISLVHSMAKIISKVLASRLQTFMDCLINPYQAAFTKGRYIIDNFNCAHILTHHLHTTKQGAALLKIDFERALTTLIGGS